MDFSKQLPRFLLVIILSIVGMLCGIIFSNFALQIDPQGMGWNKMSHFLGYAFLGFLSGLLMGIVVAFSFNKGQLKFAFNASIVLFFLLVVALIYLMTL